MRPIASVAKTMTALVILEQHPLAENEAGPSLTMTQQDVNDYHSIRDSGGSFAPVELGERFSERDLLIGLMLPSANNLALTAARWIDGSVGAFVARLNARAVALGMLHTHFADPDGLGCRHPSTAADLVILGEAVVATRRWSAWCRRASRRSPTAPCAEPEHPAHRRARLDRGQDRLDAGRREAASSSPPGEPWRRAHRLLTVVGAALDQPPDGNVDLAHPELGGAFDVARAAVDDASGTTRPWAWARRSSPSRGTSPRRGGPFRRCSWPDP